MAGAMARGWAAGDGGPDAMLVCDIDRDRANALADEVGAETRDSLAELGADADAVVLAVKPAALDDAAVELVDSARAVISVLAATPTSRLAEALPGIPVLRVMPNQPVEVRRGVLCYVPVEGAEDEVHAQLLDLLRPLGTVVAVAEDRIDAAMAVMSCSPAYIALVAEALAEAGTRAGLEPAQAAELVTGTLAGTADLLAKRDPAAIRRAVAPPGGATEAGLEALERERVPDAFAAAVEASLERFG
jgi:pyrroline-5-carboxylate reductase